MSKQIPLKIFKKIKNVPVIFRILFLGVIISTLNCAHKDNISLLLCGSKYKYWYVAANETKGLTSDSPAIFSYFSVDGHYFEGFNNPFDISSGGKWTLSDSNVKVSINYGREPDFFTFKIIRITDETMLVDYVLPEIPRRSIPEKHVRVLYLSIPIKGYFHNEIENTNLKKAPIPF